MGRAKDATSKWRSGIVGMNDVGRNQEILALDKVVWSTNDEAEFCRMDKAASRHTARGIDAGTDSEMGVT